jgi:aminoglycoside phosphotransferase (APT) family kinase protein
MGNVVVPRMHDDEVGVDAAVVERLVQRDRPDLAQLPLTRLDTWGTDHVLFRLGDRLTVRLPKIAWAAEQGEQERRWLPVLAPGLRVEVPIPIHAGEPGYGYPYRWYIAPWIDGQPVDRDAANLDELARDVGEFVVSLQSADITGAPVAASGDRGGPLEGADAATTASAQRLDDDVDVDALLGVWRAGVEAAPWAGPPRWFHGDLIDGNLLVRSHRLAGVIDWGGLRVGDPAVDLMIAWSLLDEPARVIYRQTLGFVDDAMWRRGRAWAVSAAVMALPYYRETNPDIVARSWRCVNAVLADLRTDR